MLREGDFHLGRKYVGPARLDEIDSPVGEVQVAMLIYPAQIADGGETVRSNRGLRNVAEVFVDEHAVTRPRVDLSDLVGLGLHAVGPEDLDPRTHEAFAQ